MAQSNSGRYDARNPFLPIDLSSANYGMRNVRTVSGQSRYGPSHDNGPVVWCAPCHGYYPSNAPCRQHSGFPGPVSWGDEGGGAESARSGGSCYPASEDAETESDGELYNGGPIRRKPGSGNRRWHEGAGHSKEGDSYAKGNGPSNLPPGPKATENLAANANLTVIVNARSGPSVYKERGTQTDGNLDKPDDVKIVSRGRGPRNKEEDLSAWGSDWGPGAGN